MNIRRTKEVKERFQLPGMLILALEQLLGERQKLNQEKRGFFSKVETFFNSLSSAAQPSSSWQLVEKNI